MRTEARIKADKNYYIRQKKKGLTTTSFRLTSEEALKLREFLKELRKQAPES